MPMIVSNESMFPPSSFNYKGYADDCKAEFGVLPRQHWITTEFGGTVSRTKLSVINCIPHFSTKVFAISKFEVSNRTFDKFSSVLAAILYFPTDCKTRGAEAGMMMVDTH